MFGNEAAKIFIDSLPENASVLDIGSGPDGNGFGKMVRKAGHDYEPFDLCHGKDWENSSMRTLYARRGEVYDGVYTCHSLEHMEDVGRALRAVHNVLKPGGILGVTVPPLKESIVGGHVSLWNAGLLLYRLILAGFDCRKAAVQTYAYNVSVVVRRVPIEYMPPLKHDNGDINLLSEYFPFDAKEGFNGKIQVLNWGPV